MLQSSLRSAAILSSPRAWRQLQRQRSRRARRCAGAHPAPGPRAAPAPHPAAAQRAAPPPRAAAPHVAAPRVVPQAPRKQLPLGHIRAAPRHRRTALRHSSSRVLPVAPHDAPRAAGQGNGTTVVAPAPERRSGRSKRTRPCPTACATSGRQPQDRATAGRAAAGSVRPCGAGPEQISLAGCCNRPTPTGRRRVASCATRPLPTDQAAEGAMPRAGTIDIPRAVLRSRMASGIGRGRSSSAGSDPLFWPYAYDDFVDYTFYPHAYDTFWPYAYDDLYEGMFGALRPGLWRHLCRRSGDRRSPARARAVGHRPLQRADRGADGLADRADRANGRARRCAARRARRAQGRHGEGARRPRGGVSDRAVRARRRGGSRPCGLRLDAMLQAVRIVRPAIEKFYQSLNDEQKARFNALGPDDDQDQKQSRRDLTQACGERASGIASLPLERIERAVRPDEAQRGALRELQGCHRPKRSIS